MATSVPSQYPYWLGSYGTSAGVNPAACGDVAASGSNTTITNSLATANSVIIATPYAAAGGVTGCCITTRSAGSFIVNVPGAAATRIFYFIAKS